MISENYAVHADSDPAMMNDSGGVYIFDGKGKIRKSRNTAGNVKMARTIDHY